MIRGFEEFSYGEKTVLLRVDINSPIDPVTRKITNENRINKSIDTIKYLLDKKARLAIIAHQGDTLDYQNLISLKEHAQKLSDKLGMPVAYIDDVAGPAAQERIKNLKSGEAVLLGNLRYLSEEISTFEDAVKLKSEEMLGTYLVRNLAPLVDIYINDAFAAAHRNAPSMVAFQQLMPSAAGFLFANEIKALDKVMDSPARPALFVLGGAKISDAFGMMKQVLKNGIADKILACGVTGQIMLMAMGKNLGSATQKFIKDRSLDIFIEPAAEYLKDYPEKFVLPVDVAFDDNGKRGEKLIDDLSGESLMDIGSKTIKLFKEHIKSAGTIFVNGPAGVFEDPKFEVGTKQVWNFIADAQGYTVVGGGDSVSAVYRFTDHDKINYICTAGGAMVRYLSGVKMPLIAAMENSYNNYNNKSITNGGDYD